MARSPMGAPLPGMMSLQSPHGMHTPRSGHTPHAGRSGPFSTMHLLQSPMAGATQAGVHAPFDTHSAPTPQALYAMHSLPGHAMQAPSQRSLAAYDPLANAWVGHDGGAALGPHSLHSGPLPASGGKPNSAHERVHSLHSYGAPLNRAAVQAAHDQAIKVRAGWIPRVGWGTDLVGCGSSSLLPASHPSAPDPPFFSCRRRRRRTRRSSAT